MGEGVNFSLKSRDVIYGRDHAASVYLFGVELIIIQLFWHHYNTNRAASIILSTRMYCIGRIISAGLLQDHGRVTCSTSAFTHSRLQEGNWTFRPPGRIQRFQLIQLKTQAPSFGCL